MSPAETQTPATSHQTMASNIINSTVAAVLNVTSNIEREMDITTTHAQIGMFIDKIFAGFPVRGQTYIRFLVSCWTKLFHKPFTRHLSH